MLNGGYDSASKVVRIILMISMVISLIVWAVVGFIIYVPMLLRMTAYFSTMVVVSIFHAIDIAKVQQRLEYTVHIYPDKFKMIIDSFKTSRSNIPFLDRIEPINWEQFIKRAWLDVVWGVIFWLGLTMYIVNAIKNKL